MSQTSPLPSSTQPQGAANSSDSTQASSWGADLSAGFSVALIALPLCLGIAAASGFPPVMGVVSAIIGGVVGAFTGSAPLTIKGPAAGLIVIALGAVTELGYQQTLAVGMVAAALQLIFALTRSGRFAMLMPPSVIHGMMAAIGLIIIIKQLPIALGVAPYKGSLIDALLAMPQTLSHAHPVALMVTTGVLAILLLWPKMPKALQSVPAPLVALFFAVPVSLYFDLLHVHPVTLFGHTAQVDPSLLVELPSELLGSLSFPDFSVIFSGASIKYIIAFALIGSVESLLSLLAVDQLDPRKRASDLNKDLRSVGLINLITAALGGLPVISEIVRSKANLNAGAQSGRSNAIHGVTLLVFLLLIPSTLHLIPLAALAAMLLKVGGGLAHPRELLHMKRVGNEQLVLFVTTAVITIAEDLLVGVFAGVALKFVFAYAKGVQAKHLLRCELTRSEEGEQLTITPQGSLIFTHALAIEEAFSGVAEGPWREVTLDLSGCKVVDYAVMTRVEQLAGEWPNTTLKLVGAPQPHAH